MARACLSESTLTQFIHRRCACASIIVILSLCTWLSASNTMWHALSVLHVFRFLKFLACMGPGGGGGGELTGGPRLTGVQQGGV